MSQPSFNDKMKKMKNMIVFMGGQGSGKGTFARMLQKKHEYKYIETGEMLREASYANKTIYDIISKGELLPFETLIKLISDNITPDKDIIIDGFPRTMEQAHWLVNNYADKFKIHIIYLNVSEEVLLQRIQKRINEGAGRKDDADNITIIKRLNIFKNVTLPVINWLRDVPEIKFSEVNANGEVNDNFKNILKALEN